MVKESLQPIPRPPYPSVKNMDKEKANIVILNFLDEWKKVIEENNRRSKKLVKYAVFCGIRKGFLMSCGQKNIKCADWCPNYQLMDQSES